MTDTVITALIVAIPTFVIGAFTLLVNWKQSNKLNKVSEKADAIQRAVDGPLGIALKSIADLREDLARRTMDPSDIRQAAIARSRSDDHEKQQSQLDWEKSAKKASDAKVIEDYKESQNMTK